jgi:enamine deaminase RidA (YjgF/YER057c/UK114 family)
VCDGIAYIAGLTSRKADGVTIDGADEYEQTKIIFEKHKALIEAAGSKDDGLYQAHYFYHAHSE